MRLSSAKATSGHAEKAEHQSCLLLDVPARRHKDRQSQATCFLAARGNPRDYCLNAMTVSVSSRGSFLIEDDK